MKILQRLANWADARIDRASTCPDCQHNQNTSMSDSIACGCTRLDCACHLYHDGLTPCGRDDCPRLTRGEWCDDCFDVEDGHGLESSQ